MKPILSMTVMLLFFPSWRAFQGQSVPDRGTIYGLVTDARDGEGLHSIQVFIAGAKIGALTSRDGAFLIRDVPLGEATVRFQHPCFHSVEVEVHFTADVIRRRVDVGMPYDIEMEYAKGCDRRIH